MPIIEQQPKEALNSLKNFRKQLGQMKKFSHVN